MAKDKHRIGELPGISPAAVVGLNRIGIVTVHDLLHAEFDRVAYIVDDYNEAARLIKEAKKVPGVDGTAKSRPRNAAPEPQVPGPLAPNSMAQAGRHQTRIATAPPAQTAPAPSARSAAPEHGRGGVAGHIGPARNNEGASLIGAALSLVVAGATLGGENGDEGRAVLSRRLGLASFLLEHGASEAEFLAALLLESAESGAVQPDEVAARFGPDVEKLIDECTALRAVPMLPTGKPPRYYLDMARNASRESRRICAAHLTVACRAPAGAETLPGGTWYARLLIEALETGDSDDLVTLARQATEGLDRAAA